MCIFVYACVCFGQAGKVQTVIIYTIKCWVRLGKLRLVWSGLWRGKARPGSAWLGVARAGLAWPGLVWLV